ncbi:MAG TPA: ABC transporter permease [Vicinamibacterales bacterium]|nr:ABC transporter permease [Vicinamibacterales bacterium]
MSWRRIVSRVLGLGRRGTRAEDLQQEIEAHVALIEDEYRRDGVSSDEARARARRAFGNPTLARDRSADAWTFTAVESFVQDVRYALRMIRRAPGISLVVIAIVAIAIAATTALYSLADACIIHAIRYPVVDRWVAIRARNVERRTFQNFSSVPEIEDVERLTDVLEDVGAIIGTGFTLTDGEFPEHVPGTRVTASGIRMTGVAPFLGRSFTDAEDRPGGPAIVVLSYEFWTRKFDGDRRVLGRTIKLDGEPHSIIGVMPPHYSLWGGDLWVPLRLDRLHVDRRARQYWIIAVMRRGVTQAMTDARLQALSNRMAAEYRLTDPQYAHQRFETWSVNEAVTAGLKPAFTALSIAVVLLLVLACVNIATLLLARAVSRGRELTVRAAIGAGRRRLIRQMLTESVVLSCAGGAAGIVLATWAVPLLFSLVPASYLSSTVDTNVRVNATALLIAVAVTVATGVLFGALPAFFGARSSLAASLRTRGTGGGGRAGRVQRALLVAEVAMVLVLLASAALTVISYRRLQTTDLGFVPDHVLTFSFSVPGSVYRNEGAIAHFHDDLLARLRRIPEVTAAGETSLPPLGYRMVDVTTYDVDVDGRSVPPGAAADNANFRIVSPGYFEAARTPLVEGRTFTASDDETRAGAAVINQAMARAYFPHGAVGRLFRLRERYGRRDLLAPVRTSSAALTVIGVVRDAKQTLVIDAPVRPEFFLALAQRPADARQMSVLLRTTGDPESVAGSVRRVVREMDPGQPVSDFRTLDDSLADSLGSRRLTSMLLAFFAAVSLVLAALGLYAAARHSVVQRTREIGIRMALGADGRQVVRLIAREGLKVTAFGLASGVAASLAATRLASAELYGVAPTDPIVLASVATLLGIVALAASIVPARRAIRVDPLVALKPE